MPGRKTWIKAGPNLWMRISTDTVVKLVKAEIQKDTEFLATIRCPHCLHIADPSDNQTHNKSSQHYQEHEFFPLSDEAVRGGQEYVAVNEEKPEEENQEAKHELTLQNSLFQQQEIDLMSQEHLDVEPEEEEHQELEDDRELDSEYLRQQLASDPEIVAAALQKFYVDDPAILNLRQLKEAKRCLKISKSRQKGKKRPSGKSAKRRVRREHVRNDLPGEQRRNTLLASPPALKSSDNGPSQAIDHQKAIMYSSQGTQKANTSVIKKTLANKVSR